MVFSFSFRHKDVTRFSVAVVLLKYLHRLVLCCNTEGRGQVECQSFCPPAPFGFVSHFFSFVFVLHVQFCKAKSRCTLSQVVHQQHSVTVSYHSLLQYSPPGLLSCFLSSLPSLLVFHPFCLLSSLQCIGFFPLFTSLHVLVSSHFRTICSLLSPPVLSFPLLSSAPS